MAHVNQLNLHVGRSDHPLNLRCKETNFELIWCPATQAWLKLGCAKVRKPSLRTHIWNREDAIFYLNQVKHSMLSGSIKLITPIK